MTTDADHPTVTTHRDGSITLSCGCVTTKAGMGYRAAPCQQHAWQVVNEVLREAQRAAGAKGMARGGG